MFKPDPIDVSAEMARPYGFFIWDTGGGCTALGRELASEDEFVLITDDGDPSVPAPDAPCYVGFYDKGEEVASEQYPNLRAALEALAAILESGSGPWRPGLPSSNP